MFKSSVAVISSFLLLSPSALALNSLTNTENNDPNHPALLNQHKPNPSQIAQINDSDVRESILTFVKEITVKITTNDNRGSGTLIAKQGNTYLVLTNAHVIGKGKTITIQTHDGKTHQASLVNNPLPQDYDLALLEFSSEQNYTVPESGDINIPTKTTAVFSGGYVAETGEFKTTEGKITHNLSQSFKEGYSIGYSNNIQQGMSGGPIVDQGGLLVGINGRSAAPILNTGYIYSNGQTPTAAEIQEYRQVSWGIPINTVLTYIKPDILTAYGLPLPQAIPSVETPSYGGYIGELEAKARKFVVRIDSSSKANGSGVIIAKEGKTYTVLTADHVLCEKPIQGVLEQPCFADYRYTITTHDGKTIPLDKSTIIRQEGVDLAVFKFESEENHSVAEIADYNPNRYDFVVAAGFPKIGNNDPQWMFSGGTVNDKEQGLLETRRTREDLQTQQSGSLQSVSSLTGGYELVYTSITYGGMSGGAVLDANGRLIGIHGRSEGVGKSGIQLGYSLGIPISTFVGLKERLKAKPQFLTTAKPQISQPQQQEIIKAINSIIVPNSNATANIWIERGGQLWRLGRYEEAVKAFDEAIKQNKPDNVYLAWYGKGLALGSEGKRQASVEALEQAILTLPPQSSSDYSAEFHSSILERQSSFYRYLPDYEKALTVIKKAITLSPNNPNLYNEKWAVLSRLERYDEGLVAINQAIKLAPRAALYLNRGILYDNLQKWDLAKEDYNQAIEINPKLAEAYMNRGILYSDLQKWDLAKEDYNQAIEINPKYAQAYYNRGYLYYNLQKWDLAKEDYTKAIEINPKYAKAYANRGYLYYNLQKWDLAKEDYTKAIEINPKYAEAYMNRGILYSDLQKWDLAKEDYNQAIEINPKFAKAYTNRGNLYYNLQKWDLAKEDYTKAIEINPKLAEAYMNRGLLYSDQQQWDLAKEDFNQAIEINPKLALAYYNRGLLYSDQQQWDLAKEDFNQVIVLNPKYAKAYYNRGVLYYQLKQTEKAVIDLKKAAELFRQQGNMAAYEKAMQVLQQIGG